MNTRIFNFSLMVFWLVLGVALFLRDYWMFEELKDRFERANPTMVIGLTFLLAGWNFLRFWSIGKKQAVYRESPEAAEIRRRIREKMGGEDPRITDPQFSFDDPQPKLDDSH